jgi:hypothetical protein
MQTQIVDVGQAILDDNALAALDKAVRSFASISRCIALFFVVARRLPPISPGSELFRTVRTPAGIFQLVALLLVCEIRADAGQIRRPLGHSSRTARSRTHSRPMARAAVAHPREHARLPTFSSWADSLISGCSQFDALLLARCAGLPFACLAQRGDSTRDQRQ